MLWPANQVRLGTSRDAQLREGLLRQWVLGLTCQVGRGAEGVSFREMIIEAVEGCSWVADVISSGQQLEFMRDNGATTSLHAREVRALTWPQVHQNTCLKPAKLRHG